tara:strand:- start:6487 stop:7563 length:1077 start_codon:yes stop_codon:yes gene_type:complete
VKRRKFINNLILSSAGLASLKLTKPNLSVRFDFPYKLSLAQFSLYPLMMSDKDFDPFNFAKLSYDLGFEGLEYLAVMYKGGFFDADIKFGLKEAKKMAQESKRRSDDLGLKNLLIMVDGEGNLANKSNASNSISISNHKKWIDCASEMECHSIRVNLDSDGSLDDWTNNSIESLNKLCEYAKPLNVNVIVENHTTYTSNGISYAANADNIIDVLDKVEFDNTGALPDFGNWCESFKSNRKRRTRDEIESLVNGESTAQPKKTNSSYYNSCKKFNNMYDGINKLLPYAKGLSAKITGFDENGGDLDIDYSKMLDIVRKSNYNGYIGIEQQSFIENPGLDPIEAIKMAKKLIFKSWNNLL